MKLRREADCGTSSDITLSSIAGSPRRAGGPTGRRGILSAHDIPYGCQVQTIFRGSDMPRRGGYCIRPCRFVTNVHRRPGWVCRCYTLEQDARRQSGLPRPQPPRRTANTCSSASAKRPWSSCTPRVPRAVPAEKTLVWHLYQAAIAGRDIFYDQRHRSQPRDARDAGGHRGPPVQLRPRHVEEIEHYTKLFWINTGAYNNLTARKFVLTCGPERFAAAAHAAVRAGAVVPLRDGESLDDLLERLRPMFFDPEFEPTVTAKSRRRSGHPHGQRQQPARRCHDGGSRGR